MMLTLSDFKAMIKAAGVAVTAQEKYFSELDAAAGGDGDHGTAIVTAFGAMTNVDAAEFRGYLLALSDALQNAACGSTSTLYGTWLQGLGEAVPEGQESLDAQAVAAMFAGGLEELSFVTRAREGDKTLMDALMPATAAMQSPRGSIADMLNDAAQAAEQGAEATKAMRARFGRAKNLGERSIGPRDAGASSMAAIFAAFATVVA